MNRIGPTLVSLFLVVLTLTKLRALLWCAHHEMLHAGQMGLLRRHLGYPPMW